MRYFKYLTFIVLLGLFIANPVFAQDEGSTATDGTQATESGTGATPESGPETGSTPESATETTPETGTGTTPESGTGTTPETNAEAGNTPTETETTPPADLTEETPTGGGTEDTPTDGETEGSSPGEEIPGETGGEPSDTEGGDETPITFTSTITPMTGVAPLTVTMTAITTAEDVEGMVYHWQASSGKDTYQSGPFAKMTFELPGEYNITFVAQQNDKILDRASHTVTVQANQLPIARLKAVIPCEQDDQNCETPLTVELSAAESTDSANGKIIGYRFTSSREGQIFPNEKTGPGLLLCPNEAYSFCSTGKVSLEENWTTTATPIPAVELKTTGTHNITVIVIDDKGGISAYPASVTVVVEKSTKPSAFFTFTLNGEYAPMTITLDASDSDDNFAYKEEPNGPPEVVKYKWTISSPQSDASIFHESLEPTWQKTLQKAGDYNLSLTVEDNDGQSDTATQNLYVKGTEEPVAVASVNPSSGKIGTNGLRVTLNAEGSYDPDGFELAQYIWRISDGQTVEGAKTSVTLKQTWPPVEIKLEVIDKDGYTGEDFKTVIVQENTENNQQPKAVATFSKLSGRAPLTIEGNGSSSYDPDGDTITYKWSSTAGHDDITEQIATFVFDSEGKHIITLEVSDNVEGNPLSHEIKQVIDVLPPLPAPTISAMPEMGINPLTVALSTAFYEGVKYQWQTDGGQLSMANSHVAMIKFEESRPYTITLFVTDTETDKTQEVSKTITVDEPPPPEPVKAKASVSQTEGFAPLSIQLDASASEGDIHDYVWTSTDGQIAYGRRATLTFVEPGEYTITLTLSAKSSVRSTETDTITVTVKEKPIEAPDALATAAPLEGIVPLTVTLNANGSKPRDKISDYEWSSTDGQVASGKLTQMTFDKPDTYIITLRVTAENGLDSTTQVTVVVKEPPPPVAVANASPSEGVVPLNVNLQANKSEGDITDYEWIISNGSNGQTLYGKRTSVLFEEAGEYTITLTVTDKYGHESTTETKVTVKPKNAGGGEVPPVAVAKASPADGFAPLNVTLDASDSTGKLTAYTWETPQGILYGRKVSLLLEAGSHPITLTITDQNDLTAMASTTVNVKKQPEEHDPPVAVANITPTEGTAPLKLALDASDSQGKIDEYLWISSSGDIAKGKLTNMWIENQGTHVITLRVIGPNGSHETVTTVLVKSKPVISIDEPTPPTPPSVNVVNEIVTEGEGLTEGKQITLDAGDNPDITEYKWITSSGDVYYGQKPTMLFKEPGEHSVDLTITDKKGLTSTKENVATVSVKPSALAPAFPSLDKEPEEQLFTDSKRQTVKQVTLSVAEIPGVVEYEWKASTGEIAYGRQPSFLFKTPGERTIDLTVKDKNGQTTTAEKIATVSGPKPPPLPPIEPEKVAENVEVSASEDDPNVVELDASQLTEEFGDIDDDDITWQAINKDGEIVAESTGKKSSLSLPDEEGTYTIKMIVKDKAGEIRSQAVVNTATIEASGGVRIGERDEPVPILNAIISDEIKNITVCPGTTITLDGRNSTGNIEKYEWTIKQPSAELKYLNGPKTEWISPNQAGPYTLILRVFDEEGNPPDEATTTVTVVTGEPCEIKACFKATLLACEKDSDNCLKLSNQENIMAASSPDTLTGNMAENWFLIAEVDASCSNRADVSIINYQWELDGMEIPSSKTMTIPLDKGFDRGEHTISLIVTDDHGNKSVPVKQPITVCELIAKATVKPDEFLYYQDSEKLQPVDLDASASQLVCGESDVSDVPNDFRFKWHLEPDSSNKASCEKNLTCYIKEQNSKQTTVDTCSGSVPEDTDSCRYIPILELTGPKGVTDESNLADTVKMKVIWPSIPRIKIKAPHVVKLYKEGTLIELENNAGYYGVAPLELELEGEFESASKADKQYNWTVYYHNYHDSVDRVTVAAFNEETVITPTLDKPGKYTIELRLTDKMGITSEPTSITIHVGPMLQFVSGEPSSEDSPGKFVLRKTLGETLNMNLKVNFIPELVPNCAIKNEAGGYEQIVDLYVTLYIPATLVPILFPGETKPEGVYMWFDKSNDPSLRPRKLGLSDIDPDKPFLPFKYPLDFQNQEERLFELMKTPIEDKAWLGTHSLYIAAGLFREDMKDLGSDFVPAALPVCIENTNKHVVIMNAIEIHVTK